MQPNSEKNIDPETQKVTGAGTRSNALNWKVVPYLVLFSVCFCLNFTPVALHHPYFQESNWSEKGFVIVQYGFLVLPDFLQKSLWAPIALVLNDVAFLAVSNHPEKHLRKAGRKSDSLDSIARALVLKCFSVGLTTFSALYKTNLGVWCSLGGAMALIYMMFSMSKRMFLPVAEEVQRYKSQKDDAVSVQLATYAELQKLTRSSESENRDSATRNEKQNGYVGAKSLQDLIRLGWRLSLASLVLMIFYLAASRENLALLLRLGHQVYSIDEAFEKYVESLPKASKICQADDERIVFKGLRACPRVWDMSWKQYHETFKDIRSKISNTHCKLPTFLRKSPDEPRPKLVVCADSHRNVANAVSCAAGHLKDRLEKHDGDLEAGQKQLDLKVYYRT